jgi:hypothetical protein
MDKVYMGIIQAAQPDLVGPGPICSGLALAPLCSYMLHDPLPCDTVAELIDIDLDEVIATLLLAEETRSFAYITSHSPIS